MTSILRSAGRFTPRKLSGLRLWLAADRITGLADGDPVSTWSDASGQGNHATQSTTAAKPLYKTAIVNGRPGVLFDGVDDFMSLPGAVNTTLLSNAKTVFIATKWVATGNNHRLISVANGASSTRFSMTCATGPLYQHFYTTGAASANITAAAGAAPSTSVAQIVEVRQSGTSILGYTDGTSIAADPANAGTEAAGAGALGANGAGSASFGNHYLFEVLVYDRALSTAEASAVRRYLGARYGVTVA